MNPKHKKIIESSLEKIAEAEGITEEEVRQEIGLAISYALKSDDPKVQSFWKSVPCEGDSPTVEEVINHIAIQLADQSR